jgi:hypothetical protein
MDNEELLLKLGKVIDSCTTIAQWQGARRYLNLAHNKLPPNEWYMSFIRLTHKRHDLERRSGRM